MDRLQIAKSPDEEEAVGNHNPFDDFQSGQNADAFKSPERVRPFDYSPDDSEKEEMKELGNFRKSHSICNIDRDLLLS